MTHGAANYSRFFYFASVIKPRPFPENTPNATDRHFCAGIDSAQSVGLASVIRSYGAGVTKIFSQKWRVAHGKWRAKGQSVCLVRQDRCRPDELLSRREALSTYHLSRTTRHFFREYTDKLGVILHRETCQWVCPEVEGACRSWCGCTTKRYIATPIA